MPPLTPPGDVRAERTTHNGRIKVQWSPVSNSRSYVVEMTMTDPALPNTVWQPVGFSSRASVNIDNGFGLGEGGDFHHKCLCGEPNFD